MNILLVVDQFDQENNGTTMTARRLFHGLKSRGHDVRVLSSGKPGPGKYTLKAYRLPPIVHYIVSKQGMAFAKPDGEILASAVKWADVVHFILPFYLSYKGLKVAEALGIPHTAAFHMQPENVTYTLGLGTRYGANRKIYQVLYRYFYHAFTHIHCPSAFIAGELRKNGYNAKLHVISNGVDPDFVYKKSPKPRYLKGRFVILMVGRLSNEKRQDVLIKAVANSRYASQIQIILAGQGLNDSKYKRMGRKLSHPPIMQFYTHQELLEVLSYADLYVHAADAEIEAISCLEAIARGLVPVISNSSKSATPQFALDDRSLFAAGDTRELTEKIDYWLSHKEERRRMEVLYSESAKKYNLDACVLAMENMFREALSENQRDLQS